MECVQEAAERDKERVSQPSSQEPERRQEGERDRERERETDNEVKTPRCSSRLVPPCLPYFLLLNFFYTLVRKLDI